MTTLLKTFRAGSPEELDKMFNAWSERMTREYGDRFQCGMGFPFTQPPSTAILLCVGYQIRDKMPEMPEYMQ